MKSLENNKFIKIMKKKRELLKDMYLLTQKQLDIIKAAELEDLENIIYEKDLIMKNIDRIDLELNSIKFKEQIENQELTQLSSEIKSILNKIKVLDDENRHNLSEIMSDMKDNIKGLRQGMKVVRGYGNSDPYQAFANQGGTLFIDQDS